MVGGNTATYGFDLLHLFLPKHGPTSDARLYAASPADAKRGASLVHGAALGSG